MFKMLEMLRATLNMSLSLAIALLFIQLSTFSINLRDFRRCQALVMQELVTAGEDVLVFYNDRASFQFFIEMQRSERNRMHQDDSSSLR